jgi:hypothetical protein
MFRTDTRIIADIAAPRTGQKAKSTPIPNLVAMLGLKLHASEPDSP